MKKQLIALKEKLKGELYHDTLMRHIYATDASVYKMKPLAVAYPNSINDIKLLIQFARKYNTSIIPRTAGTSLAGQCVGHGIIVDVSKYFNDILHFNKTNKTVTVQPGVVRDELNVFLKPHGLFFGPNTSTSNRCMIGGMVGNNSSGSTSIKYGVTRDKVMAIKTILSDGSEATFSHISKNNFLKKTKQQDLEGSIYKSVLDILKSKPVKQDILNHFPKPNIHRRNTGYALDNLVNTEMFTDSSKRFNFCDILAGSEGTLAFSTEITLKLDDLPPKEEALIVLHFDSIDNCLTSVVEAMKHNLYSCEMLDDVILNLTKHNKTQQANRQFIVKEPKAILMCELRANSTEVLEQSINSFIRNSKLNVLSYAVVVLTGDDITKALNLRKAGLGLLGNMIGDKKAVACIEDTAVALEDLTNYISEFTNLMSGFNQKAVYYAHAAAGELHLRPILNLKKEDDVEHFKKITNAVAVLVKKYRGSMSGEHGDGIVRSSYIPLIVGENNFNIIKKIKTIFDPYSIFNPGKIVDPYPMDQNLRYQVNRKEPEIDTLLDFSSSQGILREAEKCNGSGDCRKLADFGGTMCPSYRATRDEKHSTRARANALREFLTSSNKTNRFNHNELKDVFELCLSCKACKTECPSSVDVAALKAEFQYQFYKTNKRPLSDYFFGNTYTFYKLAYLIPRFSNFIFTNKFTALLLKKILNIHPLRSLPKVSKLSLLKIKKEKLNNTKGFHKTVYLFIDEFSKYLDTEIVNDSLYLLKTLGYQVVTISHLQSGRSQISKGYLKKAKSIIDNNVMFLQNIINVDRPLIGIEPSSILTFKDENLKLAENKAAAQQIANHTYLIEEFIQLEIQKKFINKDQFTKKPKQIKFHGHCYQKALANQKASFDVLNFPENYKVTIIPSGCCGMAGSFGFDKLKYDVSMAIGRQTLFPAINKSRTETIISANGTSCRHQILDGTKRKALHPITILKEALI